MKWFEIRVIYERTIENGQTAKVKEGYRFEIRVIYERTIENGQTAKVKEDYMFEAETLAEAERKAVDYLGPEIKGVFEVDSVKMRKIAEMFEDPMTAGEK